MEHEAIIQRLYLEAFPPEERRPWEGIISPTSQYGPRIESLTTAGGEFAGFASYWHFGTFIYIEHLAVEQHFRSCGYGATILDRLCQRFGLPMVVEIEPPVPDNPQTLRREKFYRRLGFEPLDYSYIQPPYALGLPSVPLVLMATKGAPTPRQIAHTLYSIVYSQPRTER